MLEQAVIDAQALKEAAIKNAEQEVLEKYSGEIKEAVNSLLEQEIDPLADPAADPMGAGADMLADPMGAPVDPLAGDPKAQSKVDAEKPDDPLINKIALKALDGTELADDNEEIELDLDALVTALKSDEEEEIEISIQDTDGQPGYNQEMMYEASKSDLTALLEDDEEELEEGTEKGEFDKTKKKTQAAYEKGKIGGEIVEEDEDLDEEIELDEETLRDSIAEILKVDLENVPRGMMGTTHPTTIEQIDAVNIAAASDEDTDRKEKNKEFDKALKKIVDLSEQVKSLKSDKNRLVKDHKDLKSVARQISNKLTDLNTANAKLVYQNRILKSHSLNERQKEKLVEAISNANSIKEAKVIYETLQDSLSAKGDKSPKTLSEAVSKNNRLVLKSNKTEEQVPNSAIDRMKKLAGII
jgi:hypothetical protein